MLLARQALTTLAKAFYGSKLQHGAFFRTAALIAETGKETRSGLRIIEDRTAADAYGRPQKSASSSETRQGKGSPEMSVYDSDSENGIISCTPDKGFSNVVISSPDIRQGETYTLHVGNASETIEMTSLIYGQGMGGFGGGQPGGMGPGRRMR